MFPGGTMYLLVMANRAEMMENLASTRCRGSCVSGVNLKVLLYSFTHPVCPEPVCTSSSSSAEQRRACYTACTERNVAAGCSSGPANGTPGRMWTRVTPGSSLSLPLYWSLFQRLTYTFSPRCSPAFIPINWNFSGSRPRFYRIPREFRSIKGIYRTSSFPTRAWEELQSK